MKSCVLLVFVVSVLAFSVVCRAQKAPASTEAEVTLTFVLTAPADTPETDTLYLSGDDPRMGTWNGSGLEMKRRDDGLYQARMTVKRGTHVRFKVTRGSWETVEKGVDGREIENRLVIADADEEVRLVVSSWSNGQADQPAPTLTGNIHTHERFHSEILGNERTLIVYLPPGYDDEPDRRYPVLYMHDGQNIFDAATSFAGTEWEVDEAAERLIAAGKIEPIIVVGIYNNSQRMSEYNPGDRDGHGTGYTRFVVEEVKPFVEKTYRADPESKKTGIAGSSMGGLISLYIAQVHSDEFGRCGIVSPALGIQNRRYLDVLLVADSQWMRGTRFWLDMGTAEARASSGNLVLQHVRDLAALFYRARLEGGVDYHYLEVEGGEHNEQAWADRIDPILMFLYGQ